MNAPALQTNPDAAGHVGLRFSFQDFVRPLRRPPAQTGRMTEKKLAALIRAGYGQGHLHRYKCWLRVVRGESSPCSAMGHLPDTENRKLHHPRSFSERWTMLLLKWLGALDIRDQYPFWPWEHDHPLVGLPGVIAPRQPGLLEIAERLSIAHGRYAGTSIPYVASIDILATWPCPSNGFRLIAYDCKPKSLLDKAPPGSRVKQRMLLHHRYCDAAAVGYRPTHSELLPRQLRVNLDALCPRLGPGELRRLTASVAYGTLVEALNRSGYDTPANVVADEIGRRQGLASGEVSQALGVALWTQDVDHDLRRPLEMWLPLERGGLALRQDLARDWAPEAKVTT